MTSNHARVVPTKADEGWSEWIEWSGGDMPVSKDTEVQWKGRGVNENGIPGSIAAGLLYWGHLNTDLDIIAYRYKTKEPESDMHPNLEFLARNVTEWPSKPVKNSHSIGWNGLRSDGREPDYIRRDNPLSREYTRAQWLQARKDLGLIMSDEEEEMKAEEWQGAIGGKRTAQNFLHNAASLLTERGRQYDQPGGERSMGKAVSALNAITGRDLTEAEGWLLMSLVKRARQYSGAGYHRDSAEDAVAYAALEAEALESGR